MTSALYFTIIIAIVVSAVVIAFKFYMAQRRSRFARIVLDSLGIVALLPTIIILFTILDIDAAGRSMTGFAAFMIYSVVSLGVVPLLTLFLIILSVRIVLRTYGKRVFS